MALEVTREFKARNDPITFEVLRHRLWQINDEQGKTIIHVSGSPVATEANDFNVALLNASGEVVIIGPYITAHVSAIALIVQNAMSLLGMENISPGDMYLTNDPWLGAAHQNDVCIIQPIFWQETLLAWTASVIHQVDVGGPKPGSWNPLARSVFDEAPRYRMLKIVREGKVQPEVAATYLTNSRLPDLVELDMRAQIASANVVRKRLFELIEKYGFEILQNALEDTLDYAEILFRRRLDQLSDGEAYGEAHIDHDGLQEELYTVRCKAIKHADHLLLDFSGTSRQAPGFINTTYPGALAGAFSAVFPYLCPDIPWNAGVLRVIDVKVDKDTVHHANFPSPVGFGVVHANHCTTDATAEALGKLLAHSSEHYSEAMAGWSGSPFVYNIFGKDDSDQMFATMLISSDLQGCGARAFGDGFDVGGKLTAPQASTPNIETVEAHYPILYLYRRRTPDSGGAGKWRGGVSGEVAFTLHHASEMDTTPNTWAVSISATPGLVGGYPGAGSTVLLMKNSDISQMWTRGILPQDFSELSGELEVLPAKCQFTMKSGDVFGAVPTGGGGYGDPILRDPELVLRDIQQRLVTISWASEIYGVAINSRGEIDYQATENLRNTIRLWRQQEGETPRLKFETPHRLASNDIGTHFGAMLKADGFLYCGHCLGALAEENAKIKGYLLRRRRPLASANPWIGRRKGHDKLDFQIWEYLCPECGGLISVEQRHRNDSEDREDFLASDGRTRNT